MDIVVCSRLKQSIGGLVILSDYSYYITPEEYEQAARNGVNQRVLDVRVRALAWKKSRAIMTPPHKKRRLPKHWLKIAQENGICYRTFLWRLNTLGWEPERAATQPLQNRKAQAAAAREKGRKYPRAILELAAVNGIPYDLFRKRVTQQGWDMLEAATRPKMTSREIGLATKEKLQTTYRNY